MSEKVLERHRALQLRRQPAPDGPTPAQKAKPKRRRVVKPFVFRRDRAFLSRVMVAKHPTFIWSGFDHSWIYRGCYGLPEEGAFAVKEERKVSGWSSGDKHIWDDKSDALVYLTRLGFFKKEGYDLVPLWWRKGSDELG